MVFEPTSFAMRNNCDPFAVLEKIFRNGIYQYVCIGCRLIFSTLTHEQLQLLHNISEMDSPSGGVIGVTHESSGLQVRQITCANIPFYHDTDANDLNKILLWMERGAFTYEFLGDGTVVIDVPTQIREQ